MRIAFITHGGPTIGLGHVRRCLALARALSEIGGEATFFLSPGEELASLVKASGFDVGEIAWEREAAAATVAVRAIRANVAVVDAYTATADFFDSLRRVVDRLVAIDDMADRSLPVDVVVNGGVDAEGLAYHVARNTRLLLGSRYALIGPEFGVVPERLPGRIVQRILVTLGGSAQFAATGAAVAAAQAVARDAMVDVVLGPYGHAAEGFAGLSEADRVTLHHHVRDVRSLMLKADLAVANAGMTLYELSASATPSVVVMTASNQSRNVQGFERHGAALVAGSTRNPRLSEDLQAHIGRLAADGQLRAALGSAARQLVDGLGAQRVARALLGGISD
jgi:UDP-2,4-diacetamido-2,4,6-trideoxy-beta-L-altropyranose hydrolase